MKNEINENNLSNIKINEKENGNNNPINNDKNENENNKHNENHESIINKNIRKNSIMPRRFSLEEKHNSIKEIPSLNKHNDEEIKNILNIIDKKYYERNDIERNNLLRFLFNTNISNNLKSDLLQIEMSIEKLCEIITQYLSSQIFKRNDIIYILEEKAELIYIILRGNIGLYKIDISFEEITFEEYLIYLYNEKSIYEKEKNSKENDNIEIKKEFVDDYLLMNIIDDNKSIYNIRKFSDLKDMKEIIFLIQINKDCDENNGENIKTLYNYYDYPFNKYNYIYYLNGKINLSQFKNHLQNFFTQKEFFYLHQINSTKNKIKKLKYIRTNFLSEFDYFGNFEIIENKPLRNETAKCESNKVLLLAINKKNYTTLINEQQKNMRINDLDKFYNKYFFRILNKEYFCDKVFPQFKIIDILMGNYLFKENETFNNFYIIKEGILEISLNNISIIELKDLIYKLNNKLKKYIHININLRENMIHPYNIVKESLNLKRKLLIFSSEKELFGDLELYFNLKSLFTGTVISKEIKLFIYSYEKFNIIFKEVYSLREGLKISAIQKLQKIIERLISIYNSYFIKIEKEYSIKQNEQDDYIKKKKKFALKKLSTSTQNFKTISKHIKNNSNYIEYNNDIFKDLKLYNNIEIKKNKRNFSNESNSNIKINEISKNNILNTIYHRIKINKPERIFLPSIVKNDNSDLNNNNKSLNKKSQKSQTNIYIQNGFKTSRNQNLSNIFNKLKTNDSYINLNNTKIKIPLKIEKNAPLINRIKSEIIINSQKENNKTKKMIKDFNCVIKDVNYLKKCNKIIDKYPGGYFLAVQQFKDENKEKIKKK